MNSRYGYNLLSYDDFPVYGSPPFIRGAGIGSAIRSGLKSLLPAGLNFAKQVLLPEALNAASRVVKGEKLSDVGKDMLKRSGKKLGKRVQRKLKRTVGMIDDDDEEVEVPMKRRKKKKKKFVGRGRRGGITIKGRRSRQSNNFANRSQIKRFLKNSLAL